MSTVLYIGGYGRSGSTLLERLLAAHPDVVGVGELRNLPSAEPGHRCSCGEPLDDCPVWHNVPRGGDRVTSDRLEGLSPLPVRTGARRQHAAWTRAVLDGLSASASVVVDSSKTDRRSARRVPWLRSLGYDVRVIHLVRDPRGCAWSNHKGCNQRLEAGLPAGLRWPTLRTAVSWTLANRAAESVGGAYLRVRYEDLVTRPSTTLRRVATFGGFDAEPCCEAIEAGEVALTHQLMGNRMRTQTTLRLHLDLAWREQLGAAARRFLETMTRRRAQRYGYD